jgi:hypothetical protein
MTASINASTSSGVIVTSDTSGSLAIQSNGTAVATVSSTGIVMGAGTYLYAPGSVVQVINATYSTLASTSSATLAATGLTASITPKFSTSKILVLVNVSCGKTSASASNIGQLAIYRAASSILSISDYLGYTGTALSNYFSASSAYLDSPATTSSTAYAVYFASTNGTSQFQVNAANTVGNSSSTITLMEIAA